MCIALGSAVCLLVENIFVTRCMQLLYLSSIVCAIFIVSAVLRCIKAYHLLILCVLIEASGKLCSCPVDGCNKSLKHP